MRKILIVVLALSIICIGSRTYAEDLTGKSSLGIASGGVFPKDGNIDNSWYIGGNYAYSVSHYFAIGAETGYTSWDDKEGGVDYGDVRAVPLLADLYLRYPVELGGNMFLPYAIGGIGVVFWDYDESSLLKSAGISVNMDAELGLKVGVGFDYFISKNIALNFESSYVWSNADVAVAAFGAQAATTIDTDYWSINGGLKYYF